MFTYITILFNHYCWQFFRNSYSLVDSSFTFMIFVAILPASFFFGAYQAFPKNFQNVDFKVFYNSKRKEILIPVLVMQVVLLLRICADFISIRGAEYFFTQHIISSASFDIWLGCLYIPLIAFAAFHKKLWPSEVLAVIGFAGQTYYNFLPFSTI